MNQILVVVGAAIIQLVLLIIMVEREGQFRAQAVERGFALYCPANGNWAWKGECND